MEKSSETTPTAPRRRKPLRHSKGPCVACKAVDLPFFWLCRHCAFTMCQACMQENLWGMTCNHVIWICPDCGAENDFGNR
ncbi:MAG: hypothetical protein HQL56_04685 [Magnetococcales bacterium]|nr:hypothetical protein [Magnetococcales bacterium]